MPLDHYTGSIPHAPAIVAEWSIGLNQISYILRRFG